jgi:uncharacterized membrane protein YsdA (DUF1294 family)
MRTVLVIYLLVINLIGFFIMGIDKRKAVKGKWRVAERTLFLIALLFGSLGMLIGMYTFHHKTRHLSFSVGIPLILAVQVLLIVFLCSWHSSRMGRPSQTVEHELALIQELDDDTIQAFISYENLMNSELASGTIDDETAEAVRLFFQNFKYNIHNEQIDGTSATVSVNITNIDMHALAQDLCREILRDSVAIYPESSVSTTSDYYRLLRDTLSSHTYESVVTTAYFHLQKEDSGWVILSDQTLEDELVSGFISYMNDPQLLSASEVLTIHLDALADLTADQWKEYLNIDDIFSTYNADYAPQIDEAYAEMLADDFDYRVIKCTETGTAATAVVRITSIDMTSVLSDYKSRLLEYAASTQSLRDDTTAFSNETSSLLLQSLLENGQTASTDVELKLQNNGTIWELQYSSDFSNAVMGDLTSAIQAFNDSGETEDLQMIEPRY